MNVPMRFTRQLRYLDRPLIHLYIKNALSSLNRPHNIGNTTILFTIDVCVCKACGGGGAEGGFSLLPPLFPNFFAPD